MTWQHVYPVNDLKEHDTESLSCECEPKIDWDEMIVVHNAWDMREAQEYLNKECRDLEKQRKELG